MDILSLTHNVRVGQEVEPRGIKPPEQDFGKGVRDTGSPPTRGAPSGIRADRKEASQIEPKPLQQALDLLEAELPFDPNFRDLALNKKIRPGTGPGKALSELNLHVENGKPKVKDLLAAIGVHVPATLSSRNLTKLQHMIAERVDEKTVPTAFRQLIRELIHIGTSPDNVATDRAIVSNDGGDRPRITKSFGRPTVVPIKGPIPVSSPTPIEVPRPVVALERAHTASVERAFLIRQLGTPATPPPSGRPEFFFIEAPKPGVPDNLSLSQIKIASELGARTVDVGNPAVNLETMASILNKGLSPTDLREAMIARSGRPPVTDGTPLSRIFGGPVLNAVDPQPTKPVPVDPAPVPVAHPNKATESAGTRITPNASEDRNPRVRIDPEVSNGNQAGVTRLGPIAVGRPTVNDLRHRQITKSWTDLEYPVGPVGDPASTLITNVSESAPRTIESTVLRQAATQAVSSVHESIVDHIQEIAASQGRGRVVIRLQPEDLGTITVSVRSFGQRVEADIRASNDTVRDALVASRGDLVQSVESKGLSLGSFNVGHEAGSDRQTSDQRADQNQDMRQVFERFANVSRTSSEDVPATSAAPWFAPSTEVVDYTI